MLKKKRRAIFGETNFTKVIFFRTSPFKTYFLALIFSIKSKMKAQNYQEYEEDSPEENSTDEYISVGDDNEYDDTEVGDEDNDEEKCAKDEDKEESAAGCSSERETPTFQTPEWSLQGSSPEDEISKAYEEMSARQRPRSSLFSKKKSIPKKFSIDNLSSPQKKKSGGASAINQCDSDHQGLMTVSSKVTKKQVMDPYGIKSRNWQKESWKSTSALPKTKLSCDPKRIKVKLSENCSKLHQKHEVPSFLQLETQCLKSLCKIQTIRNRDISCQPKTSAENLTENLPKNNSIKIKGTSSNRILCDRKNTGESHFHMKQPKPKEKSLDSLESSEKRDSIKTAIIIKDNGTKHRNKDRNKDQNIRTMSSADDRIMVSIPFHKLIGKKECEILPTENMKTWLRTRSLRSQARWKEVSIERQKQSKQEQLKQSCASEVSQRITSMLLEKEGESLSSYKNIIKEAEAKQKPDSVLHLKKHLSKGEIFISSTYPFQNCSPKNHGFDEFLDVSEKSESENQNESISKELAPRKFLPVDREYYDKNKTLEEIIQDIMKQNEEMLSKAMEHMKATRDQYRCPEDFGKELSSYHCVRVGETSSVTARNQSKSPLVGYNASHERKLSDTCESEASGTSNKNEDLPTFEKIFEYCQKSFERYCATALIDLNIALEEDRKLDTELVIALLEFSGKLGMIPEVDTVLCNEQQTESENKMALPISKKQEYDYSVIEESKNEPQRDESSGSGEEFYI